MADKPTWQAAQKPAGAFMRNWPLLMGLGFSLLTGIGMLMTGQTAMPEVQTGFLAPAVPEILVPPSAAEVDSRTNRIAQDANARMAELNEARAAAQAETLERERRLAREAAERERSYREALSTLEALRSRPNQSNIDRGPSDNLAQTGEEAALLQALRQQELQRQYDAFRAPMVSTSARGIGVAQHLLERPEITASFARPRTVAPPRPGSLTPPVPPPLPPVAAPAVGVSGRAALPRPPRPGGTVPPLGRNELPDPGYATALPGGVPAGRPPLPVRPGAAQALPGQAPVVPAESGLTVGPGAPVGPQAAFPPPNAVVPGQFTIGPRADGGLSTPPRGVVVVPSDGTAHRLYEGDLIPAVLREQIQGDYSGPISAQVSRNLFSRTDRTKVVIPRGTVALGRAGIVAGAFQGRLAVSFHRLIFPDGRWVHMPFAGLNSIGESSLKDQVNNHYVSTFGAAGAVGLLAGLAASGSSSSGGVRSAFSEQMAAMGLTMMQRFLNRRPEVTIRAGHAVNLYLTSDLLIPDDSTWQMN